MPWAKPLIDSHLEPVHMDRSRTFRISGVIELELNNPNSYGLDMLFRFVNSSKSCNG